MLAGCSSFCSSGQNKAANNTAIGSFHLTEPVWRDFLGAARTTELVARVAHGLSAAKIGHTFSWGSLLFAPIAKHELKCTCSSCCTSSWLEARSTRAGNPPHNSALMSRVAAQHVI
jgi:hypothetical protein